MENNQAIVLDDSGLCRQSPTDFYVGKQYPVYGMHGEIIGTATITQCSGGPARIGEAIPGNVYANLEIKELEHAQA